MASPTKTGNISDKDFDAYLSAETSTERMNILKKWQLAGLTMDDRIVRGLMTLPVSQPEIITAFEICSTKSKPAFELWVMNHLLSWDQNIAAVALRAWARITDRTLWHRLLPFAAIPGLPQRIRYTILDIAELAHGYEITRVVLQRRDWDELSSAFHALLMERALQFDLSSDHLSKIAWRVLEESKTNLSPEQKALIASLAWLCRHGEKDLRKWLDDAPPTIWRDIARATLESHSSRQSTLTKLEKAIQKPGGSAKIALKIPALWSRGEAGEPLFTSIINEPCEEPSLINGFSREIIAKATAITSRNQSWTASLIGHLPLAQGEGLAGSDPKPFSASYNAARFSLLAEARKQACEGTLGIATDKVKDIGDFAAETPASKSGTPHPVEVFFDAQGGVPSPDIAPKSIWTTLADAWNKPDQVNLAELTSAARKHSGLVSLAQIAVMSRMTGRDEAVLKLLDHIRTSDEIELRAVARALSQINTPRSLLELIAMLTRPNTTFTVQQDIVGLLAGKDLKGLQKELRAAIQDLRLPADKEDPLYQIKDELSSMLTSDDAKALDRNSPPSASQAGSPDLDKDLDKDLAGMIPHFQELSSEVKRALRTALFFNRTVSGSRHMNAIDLSPLIDMQYKAMELLYREFFEDTVSQSLHKGIIQRKLDVIGYARPIVHQMDSFESYIASLPVVKDIPFFSKFKLRKMLRALCQFEPGRRFTLDGLKAFGLYFLVFGRQNCKHGLAGTFNVGAKNDLDLAEFCKELHIFQDFRNRAAHEGFHPDASNDVIGIWRTTASVVQWAFKIRDAQKQGNRSAEKQAS
jgi:hypothetical protein